VTAAAPGELAARPAPELSGDPTRPLFGSGLIRPPPRAPSLSGRAARTEAVDFGGGEPELLENLLVLFSKRRSALRSHFRHALHLNGAADRRGQFAACAFERNDDLIRTQLRIVDDFLWPAHDAEGDVNIIEGVVPMRHRLRAEDFVKNSGQLRHVQRQLRWLDEARIREEIGTAYCFRNGGELVGRNDKKEPGAVRSAIHINAAFAGFFR
jgi:hypothetical protein